LLVRLWLYATTDGIGSARELARLCKISLPYQWICGGVSLNHHTLSDARLAYAAWLDDTLSASLATRLNAGAIKLETVAQDGLRVRASAGAGSFRRRPTLERYLAEAEARIAALKAELGDDTGASRRRGEASPYPVEQAPQHLAVDGDHALADPGKRRREPLKRDAKLLGIEQPEQPAERVVAGRTVLQIEELAKERLLGFGEQGHIHGTLTATQDRA
jgi:hypothetical protein